jgi:serine/threonine-protein kinase ATR
MADAHLCDQTLHVWTAFLTALEDEEEELEGIIEQTFALITQNWDSFSPDTHTHAGKFLLDFVNKHNPLLMGRLDYLPSLASIPMLSKLESEFVRLKEKRDKVALYSAFSRRCNDENAVVVRAALKELIPFLEENQNLLHETAISQKPFSALPALTRSLLDACVRFAEDENDIPVLCARCLGLVGGLDPYKVETVREKKQVVVLNFERAEEVIDWTSFLLERVLVKVFHSTTNARAQGFLAFVMQELLKFCGYTSLALHRPRSSQPSPILQRWNQIPEAVRNTLTPFLSSRYTIESNVTRTQEPQEYPIFSEVVSHSSWLRAFVFDLLRKAKGDNPQMIFAVLARIIRGQDLSIPTFILPFAVHNIIVTGDEQDTADVGNELLTVLQTEIQLGDQTDATRIKQCSEVSP